MAMIVAIGVSEEGKREVLGLTVGLSEEEETWKDFLRDLVSRGLHGVQLVISDAHGGLRKAIPAVMQGASWQRCRVHFLRNVASKVSKSAQGMVLAAVRNVFLQEDRESATAALEKTAEMLEEKFPVVSKMLREAESEILAYMDFPEEHRKQISSTNPLERVHKEHGVEAITLANPFYIQIIKRRYPDLEITASVLADIDCVQRAVIFRRAGADVITPDANINRNLDLLRRIKEATGAELKLMVNEGCLYKCPFRKFHFNYMSHKSKELGEIEGDAFFASCLHVTHSDPAQILKSGWIRPEDLGKYGEVSNYFKIVGRARPKTMVLRTIQAYMDEAWDGDLLDIVSSSLNRFTIEFGAHLDNKTLDQCGFFEKLTTCDYRCEECRYCEDLARDLIRLHVLTRGKLEDVGMKEAADELEKAGKLPQQAFQ
jgi:collagenase-like PrtC family protease